MEDVLAAQRILVIAPHADDEVIGSGGLIAKAKALGAEVFVQVFSVADLNHYDGTGVAVEGETRYREFVDAMAFLGVDGHEVIFRDRDTHLRLDQVPRRDLVQRIECGSNLAIDRIRPTLLSIPAPSYNQDHEAVYHAALTAARPHLASLKPFQKIVLVADAPQLCWNRTAFKPNFYVDITAYLETKLEAFRRHASQQRPDPHNGGLESLRTLALARGREISVGAAEAYECLRFVV